MSTRDWSRNRSRSPPASLANSASAAVRRRAAPCGWPPSIAASPRACRVRARSNDDGGATPVAASELERRRDDRRPRLVARLPDDELRQPARNVVEDEPAVGVRDLREYPADRAELDLGATTRRGPAVDARRLRRRRGDRDHERKARARERDRLRLGRPG